MQKKNSSKGSKTLNVMTFNMAQPSLIEASAGTGKTYTITNLVLRALLGVGKKEYCLDRPLEIDEFLIVTFTNAATSDLKARIYERIRAARSCIEEFVNFVVNYLHSGGDYNQDGLVKNPSKVKEKVLLKIKSKEGEKVSLVSYKDYSEQELQELLLEINVEAALEKIGVKDQVFFEIIKDLLERNIVPLRQAALILVRAERKINQASISTIHSFCNSTLTQVYALESGEAFNTELKTDLSDIEHEAYYQVWRRLFYQESSSRLLLDKLATSDPSALSSTIQEIRSVRLSSESMGFYGFDIYEFKNFVEQNGFIIDPDQDLESQVHSYLSFIESLDEEVIERACAFYQSFNEQDLAKFYDYHTKSHINFNDSDGKVTLVNAGKDVLSATHDFLSALKNFMSLDTHAQDPQAKSLKKELVSLYNNLLNLPYEVSKFLNKASFSKQSPNVQKFIELTFPICDYLRQEHEVYKVEERQKNASKILRVFIAILMIKEVEAKCKELHVMSNDDVLLRLDYALNGRGSVSDNLAWAIRARYPLAMIDEFQDTDPVQFNIFKKIYLNEDAVKQQAYCYLIGDPKQSIYAFRGSDINSYLKAKNIIDELTKQKGVYTLDTNYRSSVDVVQATNAIFDTTLNPHNYNPFNEADIPFAPVLSGKGKQLEAKVKASKDNAPLERDFVLYGLDEYLEVDPNADKSLGQLNFTSNANTYVVKVGDSFSNKDDLKKAYARSTALLVKQILNQGFIVKDKTKIPVLSGDIAILVASEDENNFIQDALWKLQIPSVYFSDKSSVLVSKAQNQAQASPTTEAQEIRYLMEALCDCTNVKKVSRLLACRMLALSSDEFTSFISDEGIEKEVQILSNCAQTWEEFGFLPAFLQWASDPFHNMEARLLELKDGERLYTNYCHISEIVQEVHTHKQGNQTQMHWFNNLLENSMQDIDSNQLKKRLESEHEQVKILTIHKSKGLEFPIVFTPFLWNTKQTENNRDKKLGAKYYAPDPYDHIVLDLDVNRTLSFQVKLPVVDNEGNYTGQNQTATQVETAKNVQKLDESKEQTRLAYVALTRARYAHFLMVGSVSSSKNNMAGTALVNMQASHELQNVLDQDKNIKKSLVISEINPSKFVDAISNHPELFTLINFEPLFNQEASEDNLDDTQKEFEPLPFSMSDEQLGVYDRRSANISSLPQDKELPNFAQSFLYKHAIDQTFNIISYSSLTSNSKNKYQLFSDKDADLIDKASIDDTVVSQSLSDDGQVSNAALNGSQGIKKLPLFSSSDLNSGTYLLAKDPSEPLKEQKDPQCSWSYLMQSNWSSNCYYIQDVAMARWVDSSKKICYTFPHGANAGTCMHAILEHIKFEQIKAEGFKNYILDEVMSQVVDNSRYSSLIRAISRDRDNNKLLLAEWFNDVLEAPIVAGKHHCFALADLKEGCYEPEMRFLMSNERFKTSQMDVLCREVAKELLPAEYQQYVESLTLTEDELVGYITGSIDLACRFDLNDSLPLREREDLKKLIPEHNVQEIAHNLSALKTHRLAKNSKLSKYDPELFANASFEKVAQVRKEQEGSNVKYYVIDYKSNYLGPNDSDYDDQHMLSAIYAHRYDVQFMIYTLALYRHLKRRFAIPFDATYEELEAFYNEHVGGAIYLFLRGMKGNYNRDRVSQGVFAIKLDFDVVYRLDLLFTIGLED